LSNSWAVVAAATRHERELRSHEIGASPLQLAERPGLRGGEEVRHRVQVARLHLGLRRGERPVRA